MCFLHISAHKNHLLLASSKGSRLSKCRFRHSAFNWVVNTKMRTGRRNIGLSSSDDTVSIQNKTYFMACAEHGPVPHASILNHNPLQKSDVFSHKSLLALSKNVEWLNYAKSLLKYAKMTPSHAKNYTKIRTKHREVFKEGHHISRRSLQLHVRSTTYICSVNLFIGCLRISHVHAYVRACISLFWYKCVHVNVHMCICEYVCLLSVYVVAPVREPLKNELWNLLMIIHFANVLIYNLVEVFQK